MEEMKQYVNCAICGKEDRQVPFATDFSGNHIVLCARCGLLFRNPQLDAKQQIEKLYHGGDFPVQKVEDYERYLDHLAKRKVLEETFQLIEKVLGRQGRLFDVGCGGGEILYFAKKRGWKVEGLDVNSSFISKIQNMLQIPVYSGTLLEFSFEEPFDLIVLSHVIEHVQNPRKELRKIHDLLKDDGILFVSTPNMGSLSSRLKNIQNRLKLKRRRFKHFAADHHL